MNKEEAITAIKTWQGCMEKTYGHNDFAKEYIEASYYLMTEVLKEEDSGLKRKDIEYENE